MGSNAKTRNLISIFSATTAPQYFGPVQIGSGHDHHGPGKANNQRIKECAWRTRSKSVIFIDNPKLPQFEKRHSQKVLRQKKDKLLLISIQCECGTVWSYKKISTLWKCFIQYSLHIFWSSGPSNRFWFLLSSSIVSLPFPFLFQTADLMQIVQSA